MTADEMRARMRRAIADAGGKQVVWAKHAQVSPQFLSMVLHGKKPPTYRMLQLLGLERETKVTYRRKRADADCAEA